jgi:hypothetical protein
MIRIDSYPIPGQVLRWFCNQHDADLTPALPLRLECPRAGCRNYADFGRENCGVFLSGSVSVCGCGCGNPEP